jgi:signal transduction histidine kinase
LIKDALRPIRFNQGRGYYFIYSLDLKNILLPIRPNLEGKDFSNYKDVKGDFVVKNAARLVKKYGKIFYTWYWRKPSSLSENYKKIGYDRYFKPLGLFVGTGEYVVDFEKNLQQKILKEIENLRYGVNGYFFTYSYDGVVLTHIKKSLIGKNRINLQDKNGRFLTKEVIKIAKNGGGFFDYTATLKPASGKPARKISYIGAVKSWRWAIGSGEYVDDMNKIIQLKKDKLKKESNDSLLKLMVIFLIAGIFLIFILAMITKRTEKIFLKYKTNMIEETKKSKQQLLLVQHQNKLAALGEMLGNISHQWKQPLNAIGLSLSKLILLDENGKLSKEILVSSLARMEKNIMYLSRTIDVFRDFFKPDSKHHEFDVKSLVQDTIFIVQDSFLDKHIDLSFYCEEGIMLQGDKQKLEQVILNILNNAKDALRSNDIKDAKVRVDVKLSQSRVIISIEDNALGIEEAIKDKVFAPYFTTKFKSQGTGVGLYMSKMIVENNFDGTLTFKNQNGGVVFTITIPLLDT